MVEAAWVAVLHNAYRQTRFEHLRRHLTREKAIVALARHMLVVVWHAWHDREADRHGEAVATARKMMTWAEQGGKAPHPDLTATQFVRRQLDRLGIGQDLAEWKYSRQVYPLPPTGPVPALASR